MDAILNWLGHGALVAGAAAAILTVSRGMRAASRYVVWWVALMLVAALPLVYAVRSADGPAARTRGDAAAPIARGLIHLPTPPDAADAIVIVLWLSWMTGIGGRGLAGLIALHRAKRACRPFPLERELRLRHWMTVRPRGRRARLVTSDQVPLAAVLGLGVPSIAVAPALLEALADEEIDRIVVHEWAHVQRRDDYAALVQLVVRVAAGWHPAIWWIDRQVHLEREVACDETAVGVTGSPKAYASCLATLAGMAWHRRLGSLPAPAVHARSLLARRIHRILARRAVPSRQSAAAALAASIAIAVTAGSASRLAVFAMEAELVQPLVQRSVSVGSSDAQPSAAMDATSPGRPGTAARTSSLDRADARRAEAPRRRESRTSVEPRSPVSREPREPEPRELREPRELEEPAAGETQPIEAHTLLVLSAPSGAVVESPERPYLAESAARAAGDTPTPWGSAADAGVSIGRGSQKAAAATAGFFTRVGKRIAGSF